MSTLPIPFNISILEITDNLLAYIKPVRVLDTFEGSTKNFHEDGLFSQTIFGRVGEQVRNKRFSYIDIKVHIFHPIIFNTLGELKGLYTEIMSGKTYAVWDDEVKDFVKSNALAEGSDTGYAFFISKWKDIAFNGQGSERRKINVALIEKFRSVALVNKIVVLPAGLRDYEILEDGRESEDEFNALYRRILAILS